MPKTWEQMTIAEKVDDLRNDMKTTMATVNDWIVQQRANEASHNALLQKHERLVNHLSEVAKAVEVLEAKAAKAGH